MQTDPVAKLNQGKTAKPSPNYQSNPEAMLSHFLERIFAFSISWESYEDVLKTGYDIKLLC